MKLNFVVIALALAIVGFETIAQDLPIDAETQKIAFTEVVTADGVSKEELYKRAAEWSKKYVKVLDNKAEGKYTSKAIIKSKYPAPMKGYFHDGELNGIVSIACKEGKYKYEITDLTHTSTRGNGGKLENKVPECGKYTLTLDGWAAIRGQAKTEFPKLVESLKAAMTKAAPVSAGKSKEDW